LFTPKLGGISHVLHRGNPSSFPRNAKHLMKEVALGQNFISEYFGFPALVAI
jgi:hypothetical protein